MGTAPERRKAMRPAPEGISPFSSIPLLLAVVVTAPATWAALVTGDLPVEDALLRYLIAWVVCAFGCSLLAAMVGPRQRPGRSAAAAEPATAAPEPIDGAEPATS